ncbi:hypothetical protein Agub_g12266, partial [Astrephomene gubernaculifera]
MSFSDLRVASVHPERGAIAWESAYTAKLTIVRAGDAAPVICLQNQTTGSTLMQSVLTARTVWRASSALFFVSPLPGAAGGPLYALQAASRTAAEQMQAELEAAVAGAGAAAGGGAQDEEEGGAAARGRAAAAAEALPAGGTAAAAAAGPGPGPASPLLPPPSPGPGSGAAGGAAGGAAAAAAEGAAAQDAGGRGSSGQGAGPGPPDGPPRSPYHQGNGVTAAAAPTSAAAAPASQSQDKEAGRGAAAAAAATAAAAAAVIGPPGGEGGDPAAPNAFDRKICRASSDMYFHYYGMLQHQQNMLQDYARTGAYYQAILGNPEDFRGRVVLDVGAGSGILSLFAAQAGAARVYAVEASGMAAFAEQLAAANPELGSRIRVVRGKVEEISLPERVDVLVSEPMGTLLVNERMLESYLFARDAFLKPGGKMFPQLGRIHAAAFSDAVLHAEVGAKSAFWLQSGFFGVDLTCLHAPATHGYFGQVVVDAFDPALIASSCTTRVLDFGSMREGELLDIDMPLQLVTGPVAPVTIHGIACWFDVFFAGSQQPMWLTTAPGMPTTHWFQLRCVLQQPLHIPAPHTRLSGRLRLQAHARQSYDISLTLTAPPLQPGQPPQTSAGSFDLKEPYYRQLVPYGAAAVAAAA